MGRIVAKRVKGGKVENNIQYTPLVKIRGNQPNICRKISPPPSRTGLRVDDVERDCLHYSRSAPGLQRNQRRAARCTASDLSWVAWQNSKFLRRSCCFCCRSKPRIVLPLTCCNKRWQWLRFRIRPIPKLAK